MLDPVHYAEEVARRAQAGETLLAPAAALARGEVVHKATGPAAVPLPQPSADWREWLHWMDASSVGLGQQPRLRFERSHRAALRLRERLSGRDIADELTARRDGETADSALLVYDYLLLRLGERRPPPDSVARMLESDSDIVRARGRIALPYVFSDAQAVAPDTAAALINHPLGTLIEGDASWPMLPGIDERLRPQRLGDWDHRPEAAVFLSRDGLPQKVIDAWSGRAQVVSDEEWDARSTRVAGIIISVGEPRRAGPFVRISADYMSQFDRKPNEAPRGYAGGIRLTLMQTSGGWVIVENDSWVT